MNTRVGSLARLDHIYISSSLEALGGSFAILAGLTFSDHQPMKLNLNPPNGSNCENPHKVHEECRGEGRSTEYMVGDHCK